MVAMPWTTTKTTLDKVVPADFTMDSVGKVLDDGVLWSLISSDDPGTLERELYALGYSYLPVTGMWEGQRETTFLVFGICGSDARDMGHLHGQVCVLTYEGMTMCEGYAVYPIIWRLVIPKHQASAYMVRNNSIIHCDDGDLVFISEVGL